jgi:hypothetical protein
LAPKRQAFQPFAEPFKIGRQRQSKSHDFSFQISYLQGKSYKQKTCHAAQKRKNLFVGRTGKTTLPFSGADTLEKGLIEVTVPITEVKLTDRKIPIEGVKGGKKIH